MHGRGNGVNTIFDCEDKNAGDLGIPVRTRRISAVGALMGSRCADDTQNFFVGRRRRSSVGTILNSYRDSNENTSRDTSTNNGKIKNNGITCSPGISSSEMYTAGASIKPRKRTRSPSNLARAQNMSVRNLVHFVQNNDAGRVNLLETAMTPFEVCLFVTTGIMPPHTSSNRNYNIPYCRTGHKVKRTPCVTLFRVN